MLKIALLMTLTSLTGLNAPAVMLSESGDEPPSITAAVEAALAEEIKMTDEEIVREYFKDAPVMIRIAFCESTFRQNDKDGNVLRGVQNSKDVGIMQINEYFHADKAQQMNLDIYSIEGNMEFARHLFEKEGTRPWNASKKCWNR